MDVWIWAVLFGVAGVVLAGVWWKRRARPVYVIDHVRVEMHPACVVEDRVVEVVWRAAISMSNTSRRPRTLPVLAERATVWAGWREYLATVYLDSDDIEINPGEVALASVEFMLPAESRVRCGELFTLSSGRRPRSIRCRWSGLRRRSPLVDVGQRNRPLGTSTGECKREVQE